MENKFQCFRDFDRHLISRSHTRLHDSLDEVLNKARLYYEKKEYEESLKNYLYFFDQSRGTSFSAVRLSYVLMEIAKLGEVFPKAVQELKIRRDNCQDFLKTNFHIDVVGEFASLNEYLEEEHLSLEYWERCRDDTNFKRFELELVFNSVMHLLMEQSRLEDIASFFPKLIERIANEVCWYWTTSDFYAGEDNQAILECSRYWIEEKTETLVPLLDLCADSEQLILLYKWLKRFYENDEDLAEKLLLIKNNELRNYVESYL